MASAMRPIFAKTSATFRRAVRSCGSAAMAFLNASSAAGSLPFLSSSVPLSLWPRASIPEAYLDSARPSSSHGVMADIEEIKRKQADTAKMAMKMVDEKDPERLKEMAEQIQ